MTIKKHGLSIGVERVGEEFFMTMSIDGKLTHEDYEIIVPMLESAIAGVKDPKVKVLVDMLHFDGWELRATWDDLKLGLKHGNKFSRIAIIGNKKWEEYMAKVGSWFISGEMKYFENKADACQWLSGA